MYATDRGVVPLYSTIEVYIEIEDVNDNAPLTSEPIYYPVVMENSPKDVSVIQIQAEDPDSSSNEKLTYRITSGNPQNFFAINTKTGKEILIWLFFQLVVQLLNPSAWHLLIYFIYFPPDLFYDTENNILMIWRITFSLSLCLYLSLSLIRHPPSSEKVSILLGMFWLVCFNFSWTKVK